MEALVEVMEAEKLVPLFAIPAEMRNEQVQVIILPFQKDIAGEQRSAEKKGNTAEKIEKFREKYSHERFIEHLKQKVAEGVKFNFDVQKLIDGTETEEDMQERYRMEKRAWAEDVAERVKRGEL